MNPHHYLLFYICVDSAIRSFPTCRVVGPVKGSFRNVPKAKMDSSRDSNVQQNHPTLCRNGCGFYSNAGNEGLCSVCYKEVVKKKQAPPTNMPASLSKLINYIFSTV